MEGEWVDRLKLKAQLVNEGDWSPLFIFEQGSTVLRLPVESCRHRHPPSLLSILLNLELFTSPGQYPLEKVSFLSSPELRSDRPSTGTGSERTCHATLILGAGKKKAPLHKKNRKDDVLFSKLGPLAAFSQDGINTARIYAERRPRRERGLGCCSLSLSLFITLVYSVARGRAFFEYWKEGTNKRLALFVCPQGLNQNPLPAAGGDPPQPSFIAPFTTRTWAAHLSSQLRGSSADIAPRNGRPSYGKGKVESKYVNFRKFDFFFFSIVHRRNC